MNDDAPFGELGLAYARRYADLEAARASFLADRDALLEELATVLLAALGAARSEFDLGRSDGARFVTHKASEYAAARAARKWKSSAGIQLEVRGLDAYRRRERFGFVASAWFGMGSPQLNRIRSSNDPLSGCTFATTGSYLYVAHTIVEIGLDGADLTRATLREAIAPTVALYRTLDADFGARVRAEPVGTGSEDDAS